MSWAHLTADKRREISRLGGRAVRGEPKAAAGRKAAAAAHAEKDERGKSILAVRNGKMTTPVMQEARRKLGATNGPIYIKKALAAITPEVATANGTKMIAELHEQRLDCPGCDRVMPPGPLGVHMKWKHPELWIGGREVRRRNAAAPPRREGGASDE